MNRNLTREFSFISFMLFIFVVLNTKSDFVIIIALSLRILVRPSYLKTRFENALSAGIASLESVIINILNLHRLMAHI